MFNGATPTIQTLDSQNEEARTVADWLLHCQVQGVELGEMAVFVRSTDELERARAALMLAELPYQELDERMLSAEGKITISTMHLAKGLEFRAVAVMACDDEIIPSQKRIEAVTDAADLDDIYHTERHLLYVACTRARDHLLVTSGDVTSEFLDDLVH